MLVARTPERDAVDGVNLIAAAPDHAVWCLRDINACRRSGYAFFEMAEDGTYGPKYMLTEAGNTMALLIIDATKKESQFYLTMQGELTFDAETMGEVNALNDGYDYVHVETLVSVDDFVTLGAYIHATATGYVLSKSMTLETADYSLDAAGSALASDFIGGATEELPAFTNVTGTLAASLELGLMLVDVQFASVECPPTCTSSSRRRQLRFGSYLVDECAGCPPYVDDTPRHQQTITHAPRGSPDQTPPEPLLL